VLPPHAGPAQDRRQSQLTYSTEDALHDLLSDQKWSLAWGDVDEESEADGEDAEGGNARSASVVADADAGSDADAEVCSGLAVRASGKAAGRRSASNSSAGPRLVVPQAASACAPEDLASQYAFEQVVAALVRWYSDEHGRATGQPRLPTPGAAMAHVEEALFRRSACLHSVVTRLDMASKRQVLSAMRQQPHTQDAIFPWGGFSVGQACTFQLMTKGLPSYVPGQPASNRAEEIFNAVRRR